MKYYELYIQIDKRINEMMFILGNNSDLSETEISELNKELCTLENHKYIRKLYDKQMLELLKQGLKKLQLYQNAV
jgi:hypothetical protein